MCARFSARCEQDRCIVPDLIELVLVREIISMIFKKVIYDSGNSLKAHKADYVSEFCGEATLGKVFKEGLKRSHAGLTLFM